jgi:hypothetical protein
MYARNVTFRVKANMQSDYTHMDCPVCLGLKRAFDAEVSQYIEARSSVSFPVCTDVAARKKVDMERARYDLEEHHLVCV